MDYRKIIACPVNTFPYLSKYTVRRWVFVSLNKSLQAGGDDWSEALHKIPSDVVRWRYYSTHVCTRPWVQAAGDAWQCKQPAEKLHLGAHAWWTLNAWMHFTTLNNSTLVRRSKSAGVYMKQGYFFDHGNSMKCSNRVSRMLGRVDRSPSPL